MVINTFTENVKTFISFNFTYFVYLFIITPMPAAVSKELNPIHKRFVFLSKSFSVLQNMILLDEGNLKIQQKCNT